MSCRPGSDDDGVESVTASEQEGNGLLAAIKTEIVGIFDCDYQSYQCDIGIKRTCFFAYAAFEPESSRDVVLLSERSFDPFAG